MMIKIALVVLVLTVLSATEAYKIPKVCTYEDLGDGEEVENCEGGEIVVRKNGELEQTIVFEDDTLEVFQYPNSSDCYAVHDVNFPEGFSGELEKDQCREDANEDLSNKVKSLAPAKCTGAVYNLVDCPKEAEEEARRKRACIYYYRCYYYYRYYSYYGRLFRVRFIRCYFLKRCY